MDEGGEKLVTATPLRAIAGPAAWLALLFTFADLQFVQWSSYTLRPALLVFSFGAVLVFFATLSIALGLGAVALGLLSAKLRRFAAPLVFAGLCLAWLGSRGRIAELQDVAPGTVSLGLAGLLLAACVIAAATFGRRGSAEAAGGDQRAAAALGWTSGFAVAAIVAVAAGLVLMLVMWRDTAASPWLAVALVVVAAAVNAAVVPGARQSGAWAAVATLGLVNALILAATFPLLPGMAPVATRDASETRAGGGQDPNVMVIVLDTVRADHLSVYGYEYETSPRLAALAASATVFEPGIANASWSLPSHASLLTGLLPHQHGAHSVLTSVRSIDSTGATSGEGTGGQSDERYRFDFAQRPLAAEHETLAEMLGARGYTTAAIVANFGWFSEFFGLLQGFDYVDNRPMNLFWWEPVVAPYLRRYARGGPNDTYNLLAKSAFLADAIIDHVRDWDEQRPEAPFFLLLNFMDAHAPYRASLLADELPNRLPSLQQAPDAGGRVVARYDRSIAYLDAKLGELFDYLEDTGVYDDTLIVVTSDHGENFAADRSAPHGADLLQSTVGVPLIVKLPGQTEGARPGRAGQLVDVVPTVRGVLGVEQPEEIFGSPSGLSSRGVVAQNYFAGLHGTFSTTFEGTEAAMLEAFPSLWALFEDNMKLVRSTDGTSSLFDLAVDPSERDDLGAERPELVAAMWGRLEQLLPDAAFTVASSPVGNVAPDRRTLETLRGLGYIR